MFKDFIDLSVLKDAQSGFTSQSVETVQDLCVFVSNQGTFTVKSLAQRTLTFNFPLFVDIKNLIP